MLAPWHAHLCLDVALTCCLEKSSTCECTHCTHVLDPALCLALLVQWKGEGIQIKGRLKGLQSNNLGEAMALLQGLRSMHPAQDCEIFIDNTGVVDAYTSCACIGGLFSMAKKNGNGGKGQGK